MELRVLGANGGELAGHRSTAFLLDGRLAIDAGAITSTLNLKEVYKIEHVVLTHSHFDHIKDLPLLSDLIATRASRFVYLHANPHCIGALRRHVFNDVLWPDFTVIPTRRLPVLRLKPFAIGGRKKVGRFDFRSVLVSHPVPTSGYIVSDGTGSFAISGDTGPTEKFWKVCRATPNLKAILVECSFPNEMGALAVTTGHLTPKLLVSELAKLGDSLPRIYLYHLKPAFEARIRRQVRAMAVHALREGETIRIS